MSGLFSSPKATPPAPPQISDTSVQEAALQERLRRAKAMGRQSTMLTGGEGVTEKAPTATGVLLGG